jgi:putative transposase
MQEKNMKRKRFTEQQIHSILKESEAGLETPELCRKYGISKNTFYNWRSKYSGMELSDLKKMRELEDENNRLKKIVAEQALENRAIKAVLEKKW